MARPKSRVESAAIAGMLGVSKPAVESRAGVAGPVAGAAVEADHVEGAHPVRDRMEAGVARADNALVLDPRRIVRRGRYLRPFTDDRRFEELLAAIAEAGGAIHVPVLVRVEGSPGAVEYVLVDGTHRHEAALRLGIPVPAVNLGRISAERAFAIQAMANEVRASMHVVDQAAYVMTLLTQGLTRETVQRTTGFSAGRVSELARIGGLLADLSEEERARARRAGQVTHRALRGLAAAGQPDAFRRGLLALVEASPRDLDALGDEMAPQAAVIDGVQESGNSETELDANGYQTEGPATRRGRAALGAGGLSFSAGRNARGTSVTFRMAWRARAVREDPERFLERVREALEAIAAEATAQYEVATRDAGRRGRRARGGEADRGSRAWREVIAREEAELGARVADRPVADRGAPSGREPGAIPETENPMPMPPSRRRSGEGSTGMSPRLLAGLSLPMLAERLRRRPPEFQELDTHLTDVERQAEEARQRAREAIDSHQPKSHQPKSQQPTSKRQT